MPCWYFGRNVLDETPTVKAGVSVDMEAKYRREGAKLIIDAGTALGLRYDVCATGVVYFHRFYILHSFSDFHRYVTGTCCLLLAAKMDESSVTCDAVIKAVESLLTPTQFTVFGANAKQEILIMEKIVLEALKFDLIVEHPYTHLLKFIKLFKGDQTTIEQLLKMSWTFVNDSLCTTLCLEWEPDLIAISLLYLSCRLLKFTVTDWLDKPTGFTGKWYQFFLKDVTLDIIEDICREVLDLYAGSKSERQTVKRSSSRGKQDADNVSQSSLSSNGSRHHSRSRDVPRRRHTKSRSRSVDKKRRPVHHKSPRRPATNLSPVTSASISTRDMSPISPTPLPTEPKDQLLSREAFEALQKLMRRQSGLPEDVQRSPSPVRKKHAASPPLAATSYPPTGHPYQMYYPPPHMGPPFLSPPPHYPPPGYPSMPPSGEHLPPVIIPGHPWMPPPGGSAAGLPPMLLGHPPPHGTGMMGHMAGHFIPAPRPGFTEPPPQINRGMPPPGY